MTLEEFLRQALEPDPHLRKGQKLITCLGITRPDLYNKILLEKDATGSYYDDDRLWNTVAWLQQNW